MLAHLAEISIRSLVLSLAATMVFCVPRARRTAALEHAVWAAVVCGMLCLFFFGQALPRLSFRVPEGPRAHLKANRPVLGSPFSGAVPEALSFPSSTPAKSRRLTGWYNLATFAYVAVALGFLARLGMGIVFLRKLLTTAAPIDCGEGECYESQALRIPCAAGWLHPRILLPRDWSEWSREKLDTVLAHEGAHVRRRDALTALLVSVNRCIFWFHPLAWILERRLARLADQACDEFCVAVLGDREGYARILLEMAGLVDGSMGRLCRHALSMAASSHIRKRIDSLLQEGRTFSRGLSRAGWLAVTACAVPVVWGAGAIELAREIPARIELPRQALPGPALPQSEPAQSKPLLLAQAPAPQASAAATPRADIVTIRPCGPNDGAGHTGRGAPGGRGFGTEPGRLWVNCLSTWEMMDIAYAQFPRSPLLNASNMPNVPDRLRGGPSWIHSDYYSADVVTSDPAANQPNSIAAYRTWAAPLLRALLEERFQVKTHREVERVPMYILTVASGGLKLQPMQPGACIPIPPEGPYDSSQMFPPGQKPQCVQHTYWDGPNWRIDSAGKSFAELASALSSFVMDRHVFDQTGITTPFIIHLVFAHDADTPGYFSAGMPNPFPPSDVPAGQSVFAALGQLGLQLKPVVGPREYLVIDGVERPSLN